ncbi:hypothetical protein BST95_06685 [Halioglobus japonicus]|uniref:Uncharacterized protein n=1 Tax=Halioglobus japonicus TaxID=930805 RepID=A0AAP8MBD2_9GAMM|nr:hypothetical protein BST95_06685 [Halioglobus japonicus]PLW84502.1 hypothetical protein C0029_18920 [Halioglobus japonicus]
MPFVAIVAFLANADRASPLDFQAEGKVWIMSWEGKNHGMPLLLIKEYGESGTTKKLESHDLLLKPDQISEGDDFYKEKGSKNCIINKVEVQCIK